MDAAAHYRHLLALGRDEFLATAAPAVLVRYRAHQPPAGPAGLAALTMTIDEDLGQRVDARSRHGTVTPEPAVMELFPLTKKPGASFRDRLMIGRSVNNDVMIDDHSVSRLHAYIRDAGGWVVADAGSKNGSWLDGAVLEPRREQPMRPGSILRFGDIRLRFYPSADLFDLMRGNHGRQ